MFCFNSSLNRKLCLSLSCPSPGIGANLVFKKEGRGGKLSSLMFSRERLQSFTDTRMFIATLQLCSGSPLWRSKKEILHGTGERR